MPDSPATESPGTSPPEPVAELLLDVRDVHVAYNRAVRALHGVSLSVRRGQLVGLVGANGAGKSTTLKAISGMLRSDGGAMTRGEVVIAGEAVTGQPAHRMVKRGVFHVLEGRFVFPDLTVRENLLMGAYSRRGRKAIAADIDRVLGYFPRLADRIAVRAGYLSGGEQQMLAIGRALMGRPRLLLLDEPSMGLSPRLVREVFRIIARIQQQEELTILLVEQNVHAVLSLADHLYLIETGRIALDGPAERLRTDPRLQEVYLGGSAH